jgi:hypothetical protein
VREYPKGQRDWASDAIDLRPYKGKEIVIRFSATGKWTASYDGTSWYLENIQILPNYKP